MWTDLLKSGSEEQLLFWGGWIRNAGLLFQALAIVCALAVWRITARTNRLKDQAKEEAVEQAARELHSALARTKSELTVTRQAAEESRAFARRLQEEQAAWDLTPNQKKIFSDYLQSAPKGRVAVLHIASDGRRSVGFAVQVEELLKASGYEVWGNMSAAQPVGEAPLVGVQIRIKDRQSERVGWFLHGAFNKIGIAADKVQRSDNDYEPDFVVILIGMKP